MQRGQQRVGVALDGWADTVNSRLETTNGRLEKVESQIELINNEFSQIGTTRRIVVGIRDDMPNLKAQLQKLDTLTKEHESQIKVLQTELADCKEQLRKFNDIYDRHDRKIQTLERKLERHEPWINDARQDLARLGARCTDIQRDHDRTRSEVLPQVVINQNRVEDLRTRVNTQIESTRLELAELSTSLSNRLNMTETRTRDDVQRHTDQIQGLEQTTSRLERRVQSVVKRLLRYESCCVIM